MANAMVASSILTIAGEIRTLREKGVAVIDMTVGDFAPAEFPIPSRLREELHKALDRGETNYPPPPGTNELRKAVAGYIRRTQGMEYPLDGIAIVGGARPALYSAYRLLADPGDTVLYPVPSWNNQNYRDVCGLKARVVKCHPQNAFQPTAEAMAPHLPGARLLVLNTPQNPSGGVMRKEELERFGTLLVDENRRRQRSGEKPLFLIFDQVYRALVFPGSAHWSPVQLVPACAPYVVHVDAISKFCAATGLRVAWMFGPPALVQKAVALLTHVGAWAPRMAQQATAAFLDDAPAVAAWEQDMVRRVGERLEVLYEGMQGLKRSGLPVDAIAPQGAIYMSVRFALAGRSTPDGRTLRSNEDIRSYLTSAAACALVPFSAFGVAEADEDGWFRASVGAVSVNAIREAMPRLGRALSALR
ncbi:MAG: aminotransferase class I/II-fold pyridoxal phosphate-dependent enzyme [Planctomycetota bacterium]|nr:MAG: aminotransferase class I/II-fold pyridoxal phosphate-dependent enzyme [Planctomycetota bacterium]